VADLQRPSLEFHLKLNGESHTIKMTYGLFNEVMVVIPNPEDIGELLITNAGLRDYIIRRMLTGNKRVTNEEDMVDAFSMDVDITDLNNLVAWVGDHILYFFMTSAAKTAELAQKYQETITQLAQSKSGAES
jgi:hypothetical protein